MKIAQTLPGFCPSRFQALGLVPPVPEFLGIYLSKTFPPNEQVAGLEDLLYGVFLGIKREMVLSRDN